MSDADNAEIKAGVALASASKTYRPPFSNGRDAVGNNETDNTGQSVGAKPDIEGAAVNDRDVDAAVSVVLAGDGSTDGEPEREKTGTADAGNGAPTGEPPDSATDMHDEDGAADARTSGNGEAVHNTDFAAEDEAAPRPPDGIVEPQAVTVDAERAANGADSEPQTQLSAEATIARLRDLPRLNYVLQRKDEAAQLGIPVTQLDTIVKEAREKAKDARSIVSSDGSQEADGAKVSGEPTENADELERAEETIQRLRDLPRLDYVLQRKDEAARLGIPVTQLDEIVKEEREKAKAAEKESAHPDVEEHPEAGFTITSQAPAGARSKSARKPDADGVIWPDRFTMKESGLWFQPPPDGKGDTPDPVWIAAPFQIRAETNDDANQSFGLLLGWLDPNHSEHQWAMPKRMVHVEGNTIAVELEDTGLACGTSRKAHDGLKHFLGAVQSTNRVRCVERAGWHGTTFVLPNGHIFGADDARRLVLQSEHAATAGAYVARGTLAEWQEQIARPAVGNSLFVFTMSASFAGPLLEVTGENSGGVHVHGGSQTGKTTLLCTTASVWGPGDSKTGPMRSWRVTANGLEVVAAEHSDGILILDEIGQASGREVGDVVYMLANQRGKSRMGRAGGARPLMTWRLVYLSTGETTLATKMSEAGQRTYAGQEVRLLNLSADAGAGLGVFQNLHGPTSAGAFADQLRRAAVAYCGTAGPAFLEALVRDRATDPEKLENSLRQGREKFLAANVPEGADGQVRSAAARFALIGMAGELARTYGVVPWPEGEAWRAAAACFESWLTGRGGAGAAEDRQAHSVVAAFIALHGSARFEHLGKGEYEEPTEQRVTNRAGYVRTAGEGQEFLILAPVWNDEVCKGAEPGRVARTLARAGFLLPESNGRQTQRVYVPGRGRMRVYVIRSEILGEEPGTKNGGRPVTDGTGGISVAGPLQTAENVIGFSELGHVGPTGPIGPAK